MRPGHWESAFAAWFAALLAGVAAPAGVAHAQRVTGAVVEDGSRAPIWDAQVTLVDPDGATLATALTDSNGRFASTVPAGGYSMRVGRLGYETRPRSSSSMKTRRSPSRFVSAWAPSPSSR